MKTTFELTKSIYGFSSLSLLFLAMMSMMGCEEADVSITDMEITQGIQNAGNTMPLVANRSTAVRVYLSTDANTSTSPVSGLLTVTVDGQEITPPGGLLQIEAGNAEPSPSRDIENHTLNFELPAPSGITESSNVDFEVTISYVKDTDESNNTLRVEDLTFIELENPSLLFSRIDYTPSGLGLPTLSTVDADVGNAMVKGVFPIDDNDPDFYEPATPSTMVFNVDYDGNGLIDQGAESSLLLSLLDITKDLMVISGTHPLNYTFIYGWLNGSPMNGFFGLGTVGGSSSFGNTTLNRFQRSYAHELGHNFGLPDNSQFLSPDAGWDTDARLANNPIGNNTSGRVKPSGFVDIMNAGPVTNTTWVNTSSYTFFYNRMAIETALPIAAVSTDMPVMPVSAVGAADAPGALVVQGFFNEEGSDLHLYPTLRLTDPAKLPPVRENGIFTAVVTTDDGKQQSFPFDAKVCYEGAGLSHGYFELLVPISPSKKIKSLEVYHTETHQKMGEWIASQPPSVKITAPDKGDRLDDNVMVSWTADDADTNSDKMVFHLAYSPDGGKNWSAVGANLTGNSYTINARELPPASEGQGMLKIYACDGLNTVTHQIGGLSTSGRP